jgi:hypothetical protein
MVAVAKKLYRGVVATGLFYEEHFFLMPGARSY